MICKSFEELTLDEKQEMLGKISHLVHKSEFYFHMVKILIIKGEAEGLLDGTTFISNLKLQNGKHTTDNNSAV
jgi:hypothetical protein